MLTLRRLFLILLILAPLQSNSIMAQDTDFVWNQTPILEYEDAKEYRFQTLTTYSTVEGVYIYYVSDDDTMKTA